MRGGILTSMSVLSLLPTLQPITQPKIILFHYESTNYSEPDYETEATSINESPKAITDFDYSSSLTHRTPEDMVSGSESDQISRNDSDSKHLINFDQLSSDFAHAFRSWLESPSPIGDTSVAAENWTPSRLPACSEGGKIRNKSLRSLTSRIQFQANGVFVGTRSQFDKTNKVGFLVEINDDGSYQNPWILETLRKFGVSCYPTFLVIERGRVVDKFEGLSQILSSEVGKTLKPKTK